MPAKVHICISNKRVPGVRTLGELAGRGGPRATTLSRPKKEKERRMGGTSQGKGRFFIGDEGGGGEEKSGELNAGKKK